MTKQEIIAIIEEAIVTNGTNSITANVLRPVLVSMATQINDVVGVLTNLDTQTQANLVSALNEVFNLSGGGITILTGTADPNITSPPGVNLGDFYDRTSNGNTIEFYIYNGQTFVLLINSNANNNSVLVTVGNGYFVNNMNTLVYNGSDASDIMRIPVASVSTFRELTIVNTSGLEINTNIAYKDFAYTDATEILPNSSITIKSNGIVWLRKN